MSYTNVIVRVSVVQAGIGISFDLFMTFDNLCFIHLQSHSEICCILSGIDLIG